MYVRASPALCRTLFIIIVLFGFLICNLAPDWTRALAATSSLPPVAPIIYDDEFNGPTLNPRWSWLNEDPTHWSLTASPGNLRIVGKTGDMWMQCNNPTNLLLQPSPADNFEMQAKLVINPTTNYQQGGLIVFADQDNYLKLDVVWTTYHNGLVVEHLMEQQGVVLNSFNWPWVKINSGTNAFLKISKIGSTYYGFYSSDGQNWTTVGSFAAPNLSNAKFGIYAIASFSQPASCSGSVPDITVDFDYFHVLCTVCYSIAGRILDDLHNPISGVAVSAGLSNGTTTNASGYYTLTGLITGTYTLTPTKSGYAFSPSSRTVSVPPNATGQNFTAVPTCPTLTISANPSAGGTVATSVARNCNGGTGYTAGITVVLTATAASGYRFTGWSGDASGTSKVVNVVMNGDKSVTANFAPIQSSQKPVVVLVHGWHGFSGLVSPVTCGQMMVKFNDNPTTTNDFGMFAPQLVADGFDVYIAHLDTSRSRTPIIEKNAECLKNQLASLHTQGIQQVVLIAHSMGGLVSRAYIEYPVPHYYAHDVSRLITLGTPHVGTSAAIVECSNNGNDDAACQFATTGIDYFNQSYSRRDPDVIYNFIGGDLTPGIVGALLFSTDGLNDGVVGVESSLGRRYRFILPPAVEVGGSNVARYVVGASHSRTTDPLWWPSYFNKNYFDQASATDSYQCVRQLLGIPGGNCPVSSTVFAASQSQTSSFVSKTPPLSGHLSTGQAVTRSIPIDTNGRSQFNLTWLTGTMGFSLTNPLGIIIDPTYAATHATEVTYTANTTDTTLQLFAAYTFSTTVPGVYTLTITVGNVGASGTDYTTSAFVDSPRTLTATTNGTLYAVDSMAIVTASLQNAGVGLTGATLHAQWYRAGVVTDTVILAEQNGGIYTGVYTIPNAPGYLGLSVIAEGNEGGVAYARQVDSLLAIAPQTVQLTGRYADSAVDDDGNGKYDRLNLGIIVTSTQAGSYLLSGDLMGAGNILVAHGVISTSLSMGVVTATLPFNGDQIRRSGLNGSYILSNLTIADQQNGGVPAVWQATNVYTTAAYTATNFAATCFVLTTQVTLSGTVSANPAPNCNAALQYTSGSVVTLTATANAGYVFANWSGDASGSANPLTVTVNADLSLTANFARPAPTNVTPSGPTTGLISRPYTFTATINPITATQPITYVWQAIGQPAITNTDGLSSTVVFTWITPGMQTITVTATNAAGTVTGTQVITIIAPPTSVTITGATTAVVNTVYTFTATVSPVTATQPITYVWQATGQPPVTSADGLSNTVAFIWIAPGTQAITVTATNAGGTVAGTHVISIYTPAQASFSASPLSGVAPMTVVFTNTSSGDFTASLWDFGDNATSTLTNPTHTYTTAGAYTVTLTISGPGGSATETKAAYIAVREEYRLYLPAVLK